jgi:hypothetical protein
MLRKKRVLLLVCLTLVSLSSFSQTDQPEVFLVPITSKPSPTLRLQFGYENDSVKIYGTNLAALPLQLKKTKFANPKVKLNFNYSTNTATSSIENNYALQRDTSLGFRTKITGQSYYNVMKSSFLTGKGSSPIFVNQNIKLGGFPAPATWPRNFTANVSGAGVFIVNYLPAIAINDLPLVDATACDDAINKFSKVQSQQGYGIEKITYKPYNARRRETVKKSFDIFFESNSTQPKQAEIKAITAYLEQNKFEILNATMEGGSSVEGDEDRNKKLQRDRARVISAALARYNKSAIKKDTIMLSDNWPKFREQIRASQYAWLDTLPNDKILNEINSNEKLRKSLEPILKMQRKASLNLTMAKILTADDQFVTVQKTLTSWIRNLTTTKQPSKELEPQIMGAIAFLFEQHVNGELINDELDSLLIGDFEDNKFVYLGLHMIKQFAESKLGPEKKETWGEKWTSLELEPLLTRAQESLVRLADNAQKADFNKYLKMQVDFQAFSYRLINLGVMDVNYLCKTVYPDRPEYLNLVLNQNAFMYELANQRGLVSHCVTSRKDLTGIELTPMLLSTDSTKEESAVVSATSELQSIVIGSDLPKTTFTSRTYTKPTYDVAEKGVYYNMLKQGFLKGNKTIAGSVDGAQSLDAFGLFHLLDITITNWKPEENSFFDKDIRLEEIDKLVAGMKRSSSVCVASVNRLYLNYHTKTLRYLELYFEPGSAKHKDIADASLKYITEYYKKRIADLPADLPFRVALYLNRFNWFPGNNEGASYGYDLISNVARKRSLSGDELKLLANYLSLYDPELTNALPSGISKESMERTMSERY